MPFFLRKSVKDGEYVAAGPADDGSSAVLAAVWTLDNRKRKVLFIAYFAKLLENARDQQARTSLRNGCVC